MRRSPPLPAALALMAPDPGRYREQRAHTLWREAFDRLHPVLRQKGIVQ